MDFHDEQQREWIEGYEASSPHLIPLNPYPADSDSGKLWNNGWTAAIQDGVESVDDG